jgi:hypothetical protein
LYNFMLGLFHSMSLALYMFVLTMHYYSHFSHLVSGSQLSSYRMSLYVLSLLSSSVHSMLNHYLLLNLHYFVMLYNLHYAFMLPYSIILLLAYSHGLLSLALLLLHYNYYFALFHYMSLLLYTNHMLSLLSLLFNYT